jgi:ketosteroid isomerase-like protein
MGADAPSRFLDALAARDFDAIGACFAPDAKLRALVPHTVREDDGPAAIAQRFRFWIGDLTVYELVGPESDPVSDRVHVRYRLRGIDADEGPGFMEQHGYMAVEDGKITALNLVCSGFRPL